MKPFRHLTARSRKRVTLRLCRRWRDCATRIIQLDDEIAEELEDGRYHIAANLRDERLILQQRLTHTEHELKSF